MSYTPVDMGGRPAWINGIQPELASAIGYSPTQQNIPYSGADNPYDASYSNEWDGYLSQRGWKLVNLSGPDGKAYQQIVDSSGGPVTQPIQKTMDATDGDGAFGVAMGLAGGFAGASAAGLFSGAGGAGAAAGGSAPAVAGGAAPAVASAAPAVAAGGAAASGGGSLGGLLSGGGVLGTGLSAGNVASLIGAGAGLLANGKGGFNSASTDVQNKLDPRIAQYLYGPDGSTGLLGNVGNLYNQQMATGGLNPLQQQGIASQQAVLQNPNYTQGFDAMKNTGMGLLNAPQAGNPFTSGQMRLQGPGVQGLMQSGAQSIPQRMTIQQPGLLGRQ